MKKKFEFPLSAIKAWKDEGDGKMHVMGIASETGIDAHGERMSNVAIQRMVKQINERNNVLLLPTHRDTFEIGKAVKAKMVSQADLDKFFGEGVARAPGLEVDFQLDERFPESNVLFEDIQAGTPNKQLSVGGFINPENQNATYFENDPDSGERVRVLDDLLLDHVALTRVGHAANERTGFTQAISKSLAIEGYDYVKEQEKEGVPEIHICTGELFAGMDKGLIPPAKTGSLAPIDTAWSFTAAEGNRVLGVGETDADWNRYKSIHAWLDPASDPDNNPPRKKAAYKLPHRKFHEGRIKTFFRGVVAAQVRLNQGALNVPDADRPKIHRHLGVHYNEFEREQPELKEYTYGEFKAFHEKQGIDMSWFTVELCKELRVEFKGGFQMDEKVKEKEEGKQSIQERIVLSGSQSFGKKLWGVLMQLGGMGMKTEEVIEQLSDAQTGLTKAQWDKMSDEEKAKVKATLEAITSVIGKEEKPAEEPAEKPDAAEPPASTPETKPSEPTGEQPKEGSEGKPEGSETPKEEKPEGDEQPKEPAKSVEEIENLKKEVEKTSVSVREELDKVSKSFDGKLEETTKKISKALDEVVSKKFNELKTRIEALEKAGGEGTHIPGQEGDETPTEKKSVFKGALFGKNIRDSLSSR